MNSTTRVPDTSSFPPEELVPGYHVYGKLGEGAFGQVFHAAGPGDVPVALKILDLGTSKGKTEFRALEVIKRLNCPHMVPIFGFWLKDATGRVLSRDELSAASGDLHHKSGTLLPADLPPAYQSPLKLIIAMGLGDQSLRDRLKQCQCEGLRGIPADELLRYMEDAARAIDFLGNPQRGHATALGGVQHGDIKPENMLIVANGLQLCDYGLARVLSDGQRTSFAGTIAYSAPESFNSCQLSTAADQYSLAVSYVELRTGSLPFPEDSTVAQVMKIHCEGNLDLSNLGPAERAVIQRAISVAPDDRFPTTEEMVRALREAVEPRPPAATPTRSYALLASAAVLLSATLAGGFVVQRAKQRPSFKMTLAESRATVRAGESKSLALQVERANLPWPVHFEWCDLPPGVLAPPFELNENDNGLRQLTLVAQETAPRRTTSVRLRATAGDMVREAAMELTVLPLWLPKGREQFFHVVPQQGWESLQGRAYAKKIEYENRGVRVGFVAVVPPADQNERPFYISENKVTNDLFAVFAAENGEAVQHSHWKEGRSVEAQSLGDADARLPVFNVTWEEASRCAQWLGGRLPTSRQWDIAAGRGSEREGPYRGEWDPESPDCPRIAIKRDGPVDVDDETDDVSPWGCRHMSGNGLEWTRTTFEGEELPLLRPRQKKYEIQLRGKAYDSERPLIFLERPTKDLAYPTDDEPYIGFRIVFDDLADQTTE